MFDTPPFAHLTVRSSYSLRDGAIRPREIAAGAALKGMTHVALTDRDGLYGAVRFAQACEAAGVTPVFGADLALEPHSTRPGWAVSRAGRARLPAQRQRLAEGDPRDRSLDSVLPDPRLQRPRRGPSWLEDDAPRVVLLARNGRGYGNLCRAVYAAHNRVDGRGNRVDGRGNRVDGRGNWVRSSPHLTWEDAIVRPEGLYVLLGSDSPFGRLVARGRLDAAAAEARGWVEVFGPDSVIIGVRHHFVEGDDLRAARMVALADRLGLTAVALNDVRYLIEDDAYLADVLSCVRGQVPVAAHHVARRTAEGWLKTAADLLNIPVFRDRPDLLVNAYQIATSCEVDLGLHRTRLPRLTGLEPAVAARELHARCWSGVAERYEQVSSDVAERLTAELAMVDELGLHDYFLSVARIVDGIRALGVLCACRGSAAGSLVCYALRISDVDPIANELVFERFMNPHREELPDIDIDVESARREDVYRMVIERFGEERTACVSMVARFQARMAIREVGKVLGLPAEEIDLVAKTFRNVRARDVREAMGRLPELKGARLDAGQLTTLFQVVERIDGFPRHLALHPCGIVLGDAALMDRTPVERSANGFSMTQFDKDDVAALGLLKLDVLAVRLLSAMRHALDLLPSTRGKQVDFHAIPEEDPAAFSLLRSTRSIGVFQVESPGQRELLGRLQPEGFGDLVTEISLFRPGPVKADMIGPYVARRLEQRSSEATGTGGQPATYTHPLLTPALAETFGVIIYHEQVMNVVAALTGCDLSYADVVRRQLADAEQLPALRVWALTRARDRGLDAATAEAVWQQVESFASFGFCKAHAAAFAVPTYRSAWLKAHYLPEFVAGLLTHDPGMYPRRLILDDARQFGVAVLGPDVNLSAVEYTVERIDENLADRLLELDREGLPPGWRRIEGRAGAVSPRPVPPARLDAGEAGEGLRWAVRIGLQDVTGMSDAERETLVAGRPYTTLEDLRRRGGLSRPTAENLCKAGALGAICGNDRRATLLAVEEAWGREGGRQGGGLARADHEQATFDLYADDEPRLPAVSDADVIRDELEVLGLDVSRHVLACYEPLLPLLGVVRAVDLIDHRDGERIRVAGVRVALQSPPVRSGQRVLFLSLDDRTGVTQSNFFERVLDDHAWTVLHAWLVVVEGRLRRSGARGVSIIAERAWDLTRLWRAWREGSLEAALAHAGPPPIHEQDASTPAGLTASMFASGTRGA